MDAPRLCWVIVGYRQEKTAREDCGEHPGWGRAFIIAVIAARVDGRIMSLNGYGKHSFNIFDPDMRNLSFGRPGMRRRIPRAA